MQIVINIDENLYTRLFDNGVDNYDDAVDMAKAIRKGTPLPKGHGRLIDAEKLKLTEHDIYVMAINYRHRCITIENIDEAPTIIEADRSEET